MQKQIIVEMFYDRSTKNKHLFRCQDENPAIEKVYVNKDDMEEPVKRIQVAITDISKN